MTTTSHYCTACNRTLKTARGVARHTTAPTRAHMLRSERLATGAKGPNAGERAEPRMLRAMAPDGPGLLVRFHPAGSTHDCPESVVLRAPDNGEPWNENKARSAAKADVCRPVHDTRGRSWSPSIKLLGRGAPTLLNHTPRSRLAAAGLAEHLDTWDDVARELRTLPNWEDSEVEVSCSQLLSASSSPGRLLPLLRWALCGDATNARPADSVLVESAGGTYDLYDVSTVERAHAFLLERCAAMRVSIRSKGLSMRVREREKASGDGWLTYHPSREQGKQWRGALHIRFGKHAR